MSTADRGNLFSDIFESMAAQWPDAPALVCDETRLTYAQLNARANRWARELVRLGVGPDQRVALTLPRGVDLVTCTLAVLKAGGAFLPLDLAYPTERIATILTAADARVVISRLESLRNDEHPDRFRLIVDDPETVARVGNLNAGNLHPQELAGTPRLANIAYVIYTSGSTGAPKGVVVTHAGIRSLVTQQIQTSSVGPTSKVLQFASPGFDAFVFELCLSLLTGATLVIAAGDSRLPGRELINLIQREEITHAAIVPSVLAALEPEDVPSLTHLFVGAESCPQQLAARWAVGREMYNGYGPTEATVIATVSQPLAPERAPEIGYPISNTQVRVLDDSLREAPAGSIGELYIAGHGLARCYLDNPAETAARFVANQYGAEGTRMYRTGDLARMDLDGRLYFVGRADDQVKVRGFRIELGEVESVLAACVGVRAAAAVVREDRSGAKQIVAYLLPRDAASGIDLDAVSEQATATLPEYMIPRAFFIIDELPLTTSGKLDRARLPVPQQPDPGSRGETGTEIEETLRALFADVLNLDPAQIGLDDEFFHLGGDSVLASQLVYLAERTPALPFTIRDLFEAPTIELLAARLVSPVASRAKR